MASACLLINRRPTHCHRVFFSTVAGKYIICRLIFLYWLRFRTGFVVLFGRVWKTWLSFRVLCFSIVVTIHWLASGWLPTGAFRQSWCWKARPRFPNVGLGLFSVQPHFRLEIGIVFLLSYLFLRFTPNTICSRPHKRDPGFWRLRWPLNGYIALNSSTLCASNVTLITSLWSRSSVYCSRKLYKTVWGPFDGMEKYVCRMLLSDSATRVDS